MHLGAAAAHGQVHRHRCVALAARLRDHGAAHRVDHLAVDHEAPDLAWHEIMFLARAEKLTLYDATYLELAVRKGLPLATKDEDLIAAGRRSGVKVLPE